MIGESELERNDLDSVQRVVRSSVLDCDADCADDDSLCEHELESFRERLDRYEEDVMRLKVVLRLMDDEGIRPNGTD